MRSPTPYDSHLLRMPNEILRLCFEQVAHLDHELAIGYEYYNSRYKDADSKQHIRVGLQGQSNVEGQYALALTCQRFHDLVMPILYTTVRLDAHDFYQNWAHQRALFFQSIDDNPSLKLHIKDLTINWDFEVVGLETIRYLAKFPNLERLSVWKMKLKPGKMDGPLPIGYLPGKDLDLHTFSTRVFPQLHTLTLNMIKNDPSPKALRNWLSPSLNTLILDFHDNSQCGPFSILSSNEAPKVMRAGVWAGHAKDRGGGENFQRIGIRVFADDSEEIGNVVGEEGQCMHNSKSKKLLVFVLEYLELRGFRSFWIGASGVEHRARDIRGVCECKEKPGSWRLPQRELSST
ncbi:uncharacterized protein B0J16DRAFT_373797 [Fusarium flagelliforme]|uniref:uncharacterized protein n=1 Tax=Fusarium flagelliforme TaxID=2675880 RepID=UPI001E8D9EB9|nr:uncharacterized protein B0J16DRAFT_373797 [Fusarium flagelliforme]KAH7183313.1 hypothetical protein B0J16DRAFT_373797 [Fusarium flagelliforme]